LKLKRVALFKNLVGDGKIDARTLPSD